MYWFWVGRTSIKVSHIWFDSYERRYIICIYNNTIIADKYNNKEYYIFLIFYLHINNFELFYNSQERCNFYSANQILIISNDNSNSFIKICIVFNKTKTLKYNKI